MTFSFFLEGCNRIYVRATRGFWSIGEVEVHRGTKEDFALHLTVVLDPPLFRLKRTLVRGVYGLLTIRLVVRFITRFLPSSPPAKLVTF
jgi:hypothetical protein